MKSCVCLFALALVFGTPAARGSIGAAIAAARAGEAVSVWSRVIDRPGGRLWAGAIAFAFGLAVAAWLIRHLMRA